MKRDQMTGRIDLHTHSHCSDGVLSPPELAALAAQRGVGLLALTDHDTVEGCESARDACVAAGVQFVPGIELSCQWREREVHVIGLAIDIADAALRAHCEVVGARRRERVRAIGQRLVRAGLPGERVAQRALAAALPTRTHLARALVAEGICDELQQAFDRWLNRGRPGHVAAQWPGLETAVQRIRGAGGMAVLAHPHRYRCSPGTLRELALQFKTAGGEGIEISLPGMGPADADRAASIARRLALAGSVGSDFHDPDIPWRPLGRFAKLPDLISPIAARLEP
jgi:predicted metal-dependent phosphoesterase TrpH